MIKNTSQLLTEIVTTGTLTRVELEDTTLTRDEVLADQLKFVGFELEPDPVAPGGTLLVNLFWQVLEAPRFNYITFVHLLNEQGELITQFDRLAGGETTPTTTWKAGEVLRDIYPLMIPEDTPPGDYTLQIGMYNWPTLERLQVTIDNLPTHHQAGYLVPRRGRLQGRVYTATFGLGDGTTRMEAAPRRQIDRIWRFSL